MARNAAIEQRVPPRVTVHEPRPHSLRLRPLRTHLHLALHFGSNYLRKYYLDTYLGLLWIPLLPVLDILVRTLVFGGFLSVPSGNRPYLVFLLVGSIGWYFFDRATLWSYRSLQVNRRYFHTVPAPWLPAITGAAIPGAVQAGLYGLIALVVSIYYKLTDGSFYVGVGMHTGYAALGLGLLLLYSWTFGLLLAPVVRVIRDTRLVLRYFFAFLYMVTPILYTVQTIPPGYRSIALYNPLTAPVEFVRHGLLEMGMPDVRSIVTSVVVIVMVLPLAALLFARAEHAAHAQL
jgi:ABC-type polysaccharide/polyol phosphate export permease